MDTNETLLIRCSCCQEFLPATTEYFYRGGSKKSRLNFQANCKACAKRLLATKYRPREYKYPLSERSCGRCGNVFPANTDYFSINRALHCGLSNICKICLKEYKAAKPVEFTNKYRRTYQQNNVEKNSVRDPYANPERTKRCIDCKQELPVVEFYRNLARPDGLTSVCKTCGKVRRREYIEANPDRVKENDHKAHKKWRDKIKNSRTPQAARFRQVARYSNKISSLIKRSKKFNVTHIFTKQDWEYALNHFNGCCAVCGRQARDLFGEHTISADHWIPLSKGGTSTPDNIIPLCFGLDGCNNKKHDIMPQEWLERTYGDKKAKVIMRRINQFFEGLSPEDKTS